MDNKYITPLINHKFLNKLVHLSKRENKQLDYSYSNITKIADAVTYNVSLNEAYNFSVKVKVTNSSIYKYLGCSTKECNGIKIININKEGLSKCNKCNDFVIPKTINILTVIKY